jgi:hypothetical protein
MERNLPAKSRNKRDEAPIPIQWERAGPPGHTAAVDLHHVLIAPKLDKTVLELFVVIRRHVKG